MTKKEKARIQKRIQAREVSKGLRPPPRRRHRRVLTDAQREERKRITEKNRLDRLMARIAYREMTNDYLETQEALEAKRASEEPGRFGRGESAIDQYVTHGVIEADRQYHGCRNVRDDMDDGDIDAWRHAD